LQENDGVSRVSIMTKILYTSIVIKWKHKWIENIK
jgi:hypothetical protein